jgi:hypothetical protein
MNGKWQNQTIGAAEIAINDKIPMSMPSNDLMIALETTSTELKKFSGMLEINMSCENKSIA